MIDEAKLEALVTRAVEKAIAKYEATRTVPVLDPNEELPVKVWAAEKHLSEAAAYKHIARGHLRVRRLGPEPEAGKRDKRPIRIRRCDLPGGAR